MRGFSMRHNGCRLVSTAACATVYPIACMAAEARPSSSEASMARANEGRWMNQLATMMLALLVARLTRSTVKRFHERMPRMGRTTI
jgi:hypothetical protein